MTRNPPRPRFCDQTAGREVAASDRWASELTPSPGPWPRPGRKIIPCWTAKENRSRLERACLASGRGFYRDYRADRVAVAFRPTKAKTDCGGQLLHHIFKNPQLRGIAVLQEHFLAAVVVKIGERESAAILDKIQTHRAGNIGKRAIPIVGVEHIPLISAPGRVRANEFVDRAPSLFIVVRQPGFVWRIGYYLPPKETVQILVRRTRDHAIRNVKIREAVVVKIPSVARPRPAAIAYSGGNSCVFEGERFRRRAAPGSRIPKQRIPHGVFAVERANLLRRLPLKNILPRYPFPRRGPHVGDIKIVGSVIVVVEPANAHARAHVFHASFGGNVGESSVTVIVIKIFAAEIVHHIKVWPAVAVVIIPGAAEAVAGIVLIEAGLRRNIAKRSVALVAHHEVRRTVFRGVVRDGILVLIRALVIGVETEINIQPAVAVIIGQGGAGESSLRWLREMKRVSLAPKPSAALIQEQQRAVGAHDDHVLAAVVIEIPKQRARRVF